MLNTYKPSFSTRAGTLDVWRSRKHLPLMPFKAEKNISLSVTSWRLSALAGTPSRRQHLGFSIITRGYISLPRGLSSLPFILATTPSGGNSSDKIRRIASTRPQPGHRQVARRPHCQLRSRGGLAGGSGRTNTGSVPKSQDVRS